MYALCKRALDVSVAGFLLLAFSPILLLVTILVKIKLGSPVFFPQERAGLNGRPFGILKFRTMTSEIGADGELLADEVRLTRFGQVLRAYSLDELPQLINIIKGEMSLVGPRPLHVRYTPRYTEEQRLRLTVPPGITGWAQTNGRNTVDWETRFKLDSWYVSHRSLALDLRILLMTAKKVLLREGISAEGHATMPEFHGEPDSKGPADTIPTMRFP